MIKMFESRSRREAFHIWSRPVIFDLNMPFYLRDFILCELIVGLNNENTLKKAYRKGEKDKEKKD